jgi:hypothetical protein
MKRLNLKHIIGYETYSGTEVKKYLKDQAKLTAMQIYSKLTVS